MKIIKLAAVVTALLVASDATAALAASIYQVISVNVIPGERAKVNGKIVNLEELAASIDKIADHEHPLAVKLYVQIGMRKSDLEKVKALCRKAGVSAFSIIAKA